MKAYTQYSDEELATLMKGGDRYAFTEIFERYHSLLYVFTLRRLGSVRESEDLVSDLFVGLWAKHANFSISNSLATYLYTAARNRVYNNIEHNKIKGRYLDSFKNYVEKGVDDTDHLIRTHELATLIDREIENLPAKMREVFLLSRKTYLSQKQIAEQLGITEVTVKSHMNHALKILKRRLGTLFFMVFLWL